MTYKIIDLVQGSEDWKNYRRTKITATDAAKIMNLSPFCTPLQLWEEKLGLREPQALNDKMREGSLLEEKARDFFNKKNNLNFRPIVLESTTHPFAMASLDGIDFDSSILEIKCGKSSHEMAKNHEIAPYYIAQLQHQMMVSNQNLIVYFSYRSDEDNVFWVVKRDDIFIEKMIEAEKEFYRCLMEFTPPASTDKDYVLKEDKDWRIHANIWKSVKKQIKDLEAREEGLRNELIRMSNDQSCQGEGVRVSKCIKRGCVDYSGIECLKNVNLDHYRKKSSIYFRISENE